MTNWPVNSGAVGVGRSAGMPFLLLQVTDSATGTQSRAILTTTEAEAVIADLQDQIASVRSHPAGLLDPEFRPTS